MLLLFLLVFFFWEDVGPTSCCERREDRFEVFQKWVDLIVDNS